MNKTRIHTNSLCSIANDLKLISFLETKDNNCVNLSKVYVLSGKRLIN